MATAIFQAWASWKKAPGIALLAVIAFAIGIGASTAIFTVINGVLLRPVPYPHGERFVVLFGVRTNEPNTFNSLSVQEAQQYQDQTTSFDLFGWFRTGNFNLTEPGDPQSLSGAEVTPALARELGPPLVGQWFTDGTGAVISSTLWRRLGGRPDIIGSAITLDGRRYTVTGVMPPSFEMPIAFPGLSSGNATVWIALDPSPSIPNPGGRIYFTYARRKPGISVEQADADVGCVAAIIAASDPVRFQFYSATVAGLRQTKLSNLRPTLLALFAGSGLLLLIACANVGTLLLARSVVRARETAIHVALGASRGQLALRYFAEGAFVSLAGAAAGVVLSAIFVRQIVAAASDFIPRADGIALDWKVLAFSTAVAIAVGVLAGLAPLWQAFHIAPNAVLTEGVRASAAAPARRLSHAFVTAEIALAFTLLTASAVLGVHLRNLGRVSLGFDPNGLLTFDLRLPRRMASAERRVQQDRLIDALRRIPGVTSAAFVNQLPASPGCFSTSILVDGRPADAPALRTCIVMTTPDFLQTMRIPLRSGRFLNAQDDDRKDVLTVAISETAARTQWSGRNPIGASGRFSGPDGSRFEVIGVVGDVRNNGLNKPPEPEIYFSANATAFNAATAVVRSELPIYQLVPTVRRAIGQVDPTLPLVDVATMNDVITGTLQLDRLSSIVMTFFGIAALLMATLGVYGVVSYFVRQRTVELGTRMALGAVNRDLVSLVLGGGLKLSLAGLASGSVALIGSLWFLVRFLEVTDIGWPPVVFSMAVVAFVGTAAASVPAWRTTLLTPMAAIREQPPSVWRWARQGMQRAARDIGEAVGTGDSGSDLSSADVLTAFVDAARGADSYADALRSVLASVCDQLRVDSAALLERRDGQAAYRCLVAAGALDASAPTLPADGFLTAQLRAYPRPLSFSGDDLTALSEWAAAHRPDRLDELRALAAANVRLAVPLRTRNEIIGVLLLGQRPHRAAFTADEKQVLRAAADQFALMTENARLTTRVVEQEVIRRDIALASDVQRRLLPEAPPRAESVEFSATSIPARHIGGDYYDFLELPGGFGIALADVSGKGVAAALIMSVVQASLRIISSESGISLPRIVARMNQFVYQSTPASKYATFFYAQLDEQRRELRYVNAGHNPPYLVGSTQPPVDAFALPEITQLTVGGTVVGMFPEASYEEATVALSGGDVLFAFTDGVPDAQNPDGEEFGEERLQQLLRESAHLSADDISLRISAELKNWIRDAEQFDDLTFIVMKMR